MPNLASHWGIENVRLPYREGSVHRHMSVFPSNQHLIRLTFDVQTTVLAPQPGGIGSCPCKSQLLDPFYILELISCSLFTSGTMIGFDASGHVAEETRNARYVESSHLFASLVDTCRSLIAGRGILTSALATGIMGFLTTILFLFCTPDLDTLFSLDAPQPFVQIYAMALGKGPSIFMTIIAVVGLILVNSLFSAFRLND